MVIWKGVNSLKDCKTNQTLLILSCPDSQQANEKEGALFLVDVKEVYAIKQDLNHSNSLEYWLKHVVGKTKIKRLILLFQCAFSLIDIFKK